MNAKSLGLASGQRRDDGLAGEVAAERDDRGDRGRDRQHPGDLPLQPVRADELRDDHVERDEARVARRRRHGDRRVERLHGRGEGEQQDPDHDGVAAVEQQRAPRRQRVAGEAREADRAGDLRHRQLRVRAEHEGLLERTGRDEDEQRQLDPKQEHDRQRQRGQRHQHLDRARGREQDDARAAGSPAAPMITVASTGRSLSGFGRSCGTNDTGVNGVRRAGRAAGPCGSWRSPRVARSSSCRRVPCSC